MADNYDTQVKFGADTGDLKAGMEQGANEVKAATGKMADSFKNLGSNVKASMSKMTQDIGHGAKEGTEKLEGFGKGIESLRSKFMLLGEVLAAGWIGEKMIDMVKHTAEVGDELLKTSQKTGVSIQYLSGLKYAAELADVSFEALQNGMKRLSMAMNMAQLGSKQQEAAFKAVGVSITDANGNLRSMEQLLPEIADKFAATADGTNKTALALALFGRAGAEMIPLLDSGSKGMADMAREAERLGLVWDKETAEAAERLNDDTRRMHASFEGITTHLAQAFIPVMNNLVNAVSESAAKGGLLNNVLTMLGAGFRYLAVFINDVVGVMKILGTTIGAVAAAIANPTKIGGIWDDYLARIKEIRTETQKTNEELLGHSEGGKMPGEGANKPQMTAMVNPSKSSDQIAAWKAQLEAKKEDEKQYFKDSLQEDMAFWESKLNVVKKGSKEERAIRHELFTLHKQEAQQELAEKVSNIQYQMTLAKDDTTQKVALAKQEAELIKATYGDKSRQYIAELRKVEEAERAHKDAMAKLEQEKIDAAKASALNRIEIDRETLRYQKEMGTISAADELNGLRNLKEQEYEIELKAAQDKLQFVKDDVIAKQKAMDEIEAMAQKHALDMRKIEHDTSIAVKNDYQNMLSPIASAFDSSIKGMIQGTLTFQKAMSGISRAILGEFVNMGVKKLTNWVATEMGMTSATAAGAATRTGIDAAASATSGSLSVGAGIKNIMVSAWETMANVYKSIAAIPYVGPFLAPAMAAGAFGVVAGYAGHLASAEGGFDIPDGVNPLTQLHKREMVLPAKQADVIRNMADNGGGNGSAINFHFNGPTDRRGIERWYKENAVAMAPALRTLARNFVPVKA